MRKQSFVAVLGALAAVALSVGVLTAGAGVGNGAPSGPHYNLNLIGFASGQTVKNSTGSGGNVIHVPLYGHCQIDLFEGDFQVLDDNCTGGQGDDAAFQLPNPDPTNSGTSEYSVYVATRGKPLGSASMQSCFTDSTGTYCNVVYPLDLSRNWGDSKYMNVTKNLLYIYSCINGTIQRVSLFADSNASYFWTYDNNGLRNAGFRFYPGVQTTVPPASGAAC
jgi:hypothetical protein